MIPSPSAITLLQKERQLTLVYPEATFTLPCAYLRAHSPAADAAVADIDPQINIVAMEPVGQYAIKLAFTDGHGTGIYSWECLYRLGQQFQQATERQQEAPDATN